MRAVGYVARQSKHGALEATADGGSFSWKKDVVPAAGSWGDSSTLSLSFVPYPEKPADQIVRYCEDSGHKLVAIFGVDGGTDKLYREWIRDTGEVRGPNRFATQLGEGQFADLIEALAGPSGHPALVVIPDASHLADDLETLVERLLLIRRTGSETQCTDTEMPDPLQSGEELLGLRGAPDWLRKKIRTKVMEKASRGQVLGRTPYGYRCSAEGNLEPVPAEAEVVKSVFRWYVGDESSLDGEAEECNGIGMRLIAQRLTEQGVPTRSGKPWSATTISIILKNRVYVGTYSRFGFLVVGNHEPIIGRSLFRRSQDALASKHRKIKEADSDGPFLLGGLLQCGHCGHGVPGLTRRRSWKRRDDSVATKTYRYYEFYECPARRHRSDVQQNGKCPTWRAAELDDRVRKMVSEWPDWVRDEIEPRETGLTLEHRLENAEKLFLEETSRVSAGRGDLENLEPRLIEIKTLRQAIAVRNGNESTNGAAVSGSNGSPRRKIARLISDALESSDPERAHEALASVVEKVVVTDSVVSVNPRIRP